MFAKLLAIIAGSLLLTALLTPPVYTAILYLIPDFSQPFSRVFDRVAMVAVLIFVLIFRREFGLSEALHYLKKDSAGRNSISLAAGILISAVSGAALLYLLVELGVLNWRVDAAPAAGKVARVCAGALLVSLIEECFFRVILLRGLMRKYSFVTAATLSSVVYAAAHFVTPVKSFSYTSFSWTAGFEYLTAIFERFFYMSTVHGMLGLFMVGIILCYTIWASGSLYLCMGLHAGWVMLIKFSNMLTDPPVPPESLAGAGARYYLIAQPLTWVYLTLLFLAFSIYFGRTPDEDKA